MAVDPGTPRPTGVKTEPDPYAALMGRITDLENKVAALERGTVLRDASISGGVGLTVLDSNGNVVVTLSTQNGGGVIASDTSGNQMAIFGPLNHSNPGQYGVEVNVGGTWVQLGAQVATWNNLSGKPATFPPTVPIAGSNISGAVASATAASTADGSPYAFNNNVPGTSFYAVWVGNDAGNHFGKNTSSIRYKTNVVEHYTDPANVLALVPVTYDRIDSGVTEYGLIAEQVAEHFPELVQWFEGHIDNVRYDLLAVALLSVVRSQDTRITALEAMAKNAQTANGSAAVTATHYTPPQLPPVAAQNGACNNPPATPPAPLPYTIQPQS